MKLLNDFQKKAAIDSLNKDFDILHLALNPSSVYDAGYYVFVRHNGIIHVIECAFGENAWIEADKDNNSYSLEHFIIKCKKIIKEALDDADNFGCLEDIINSKHNHIMWGLLFNCFSNLITIFNKLDIIDDKNFNITHFSMQFLSELVIDKNKTFLEAYNEIFLSFDLDIDFLINKLILHSDCLSNKYKGVGI